MRTLLIAAAALAVSAQAEARHTKAAPPMPVSNPGTWVLPDDYPAAALRDNLEGTVGFAVIVGSDGSVISCKVTESSGNKELDDAACAKIAQRGAFQPATDKKGRPMQGTWSNRVRWQIPKDPEAPAPSYLVASFIVETDGSITECHVEKAEGAAKAAEEKMCPSAPTVQPILGEDGKPVRKRVRLMSRVIYEDVPN